MKKTLCIALALFMLVNIAACGNKTAEATTAAETTAAATVAATTAAPATAAATEAPTTEAVPETRVWTDSVGREVELPAKVEKIALSGPLAQIVLYALAPEKLVGFSNDWGEKVQQYIPAEYLALPTLGQLYGGKGEINLEELLKADPDVVIDVGEPKKTIKEDLDALQEQTGIPFVHVTMTTETAGDAFRKLGDLLGLEDRAEEFAVYCEGVYKRAQDIMAKVGDNKANLLYVTGDAGLNVIAKDSYHAEIIDLLSNNLAVLEDPSSKGTGNEVDMEQILTWNPDVVVFAPGSIYSTVESMDEWKDINAIKDGKYYEVPFGPYNWMGFPPSVQRYLGVMWLPALLYPEYVDYDLKQEVKDYYKMFYHSDLTDEQYAELTANSIGKLIE